MEILQESRVVLMAILIEQREISISITHLSHIAFSLVGHRRKSRLVAFHPDTHTVVSPCCIVTVDFASLKDLCCIEQPSGLGV